MNRARNYYERDDGPTHKPTRHAITTTHPTHSTEERESVCNVSSTVDLCVSFDELREWIGQVGLEIGRAEEDINAGFADEPLRVTI